MSAGLSVIRWIVPALILTQCHCYVANDEMSMKEQRVSAQKPCDVADLRLRDMESVVKCLTIENTDGLDLRCLVSLDVEDRNEMALKECRHGTWTDRDLGPKREIHKRFWGLIVGAFLGAAACYFLCGSGGGTVVHTVTKTPPGFATPCRPSDLQNTYVVEAGGTSAVVTWSTPTATDSDGQVESVVQTGGSPSGSQFEGSTTIKTHYITYLATDNDGLTASCYFSFSVEIKTCDTAVWPNNGQRSCSQNNHLGSVCTYTCNTGHEVSGSSQITCQGSSAPAWSSTPTCEKKSCGTPPTLGNGQVSCSSSAYEYLQVCDISCDTDYTLSGTPYIQCQADGTWTSLESTNCLDSVPPSLTCKTPQIFYADRSSNSLTVEWTLPTVTDNVDPSPTLNQTGGQQLGSVFQIGSSFVMYTAKDNIGNESPECSIEIRVEETACQHPTDTINDSNMEYVCGGATYTYGTECTLSCSYNLPLVGSDLLICERENNNSTDLSVGTWSWGSGEKPYCNETSCPALDAPVNGALQSNSLENNKIYTMFCNANFDIPSVSTGFTGVFYCQNDGNYVPPIAVPDCIIPRNPRAIRLPSEIYYYSGDCTDPATQAAIKSQVQEIFDTTVDILFRAICPTTNNCTISDLSVICGSTTRRRRSVSKRSVGTLSESVAAFNQLKNREKRNTNPTVIIDFNLVTSTNEAIDFLVDLTFIDNLQNGTLKPLMVELVNNGTFNISGFSEPGPTYQSAEHGDIYCQGGHLLVQTTCVPCPSGYFLNSSVLCELCPLGFYSNESGLTSCIACPSGYSTLATGSKNEGKCDELCPAGQYSATGLVPCTVCPVGYYQNGTGQKSCTQCTSGTTEFAGSVTSTECQAFHILVDNTTGVVTAGTSINMANMTIMLWVKPFANMTVDAHIRFTSEGNDVIIINITEVIRVKVPADGVDMEISDLPSASWKHVTITLNTVTGELSTYINGVLGLGVMISSSTSSLISNGEILLMSIGSTGIFIADLHLEDAVLSQSDINSMTSSCWTERSGDVFGMKDFRDTTLTGVQLQTPLSCDPIDECTANPCNNHTCINGINTYKCYCSSGWSGVNCDTPPDYCIDNGCANGATCVSGQPGYTCTCMSGYSGDLCEVAPVDGGWSEWSSYASCAVTCGGSIQTRTRSCDSPEPSPQGANCSGEAIESQTCGDGSCPTCVELTRGYGMLTNCTVEEGTGDETCLIYCRDGYALPSNLQSETFTCGVSTGYIWSPNDNPPSCVDPSKPGRASITADIETDVPIADADQPVVQQAVIDNLSTVQCKQDDRCTVAAEILNSRRKRSIKSTKRSTGSTIQVTLTAEMTETGVLDIQNYLSTSTANPSLQELIDVITSLESSASFINTSSSSIFDVSVNGYTYTTSQSTLTFTGNITCPTGQTATDGICVPCPGGTYYIDGYCTYCDKGTYSDSTGQTSCTSCPSGLSTSTIGSYAVSQCTESVNITSTTTSTTTTTSSASNNVYIDNSSSDNKGIFIGVAIAAVALVITVPVCAYYVHKQHKKKIDVENSSTSQRSRQQNKSQNRPVSREKTIMSVKDIEIVENPTYQPGANSYIPDNVRPSVSPPPSYQEFPDNVRPSYNIVTRSPPPPSFLKVSNDVTRSPPPPFSPKVPDNVSPTPSNPEVPITHVTPVGSPSSTPTLLALHDNWSQNEDRHYESVISAETEFDSQYVDMSGIVGERQLLFKS